MEIAFIIVIAYLIVYRTSVGTWCALTGKQTPWERSRAARTGNASDRHAAWQSKRTLRGFFGRLYGDLFEDLNDWWDESRARKIDRQVSGGRRRSLREWVADVVDLARGAFQRDKNHDTEAPEDTDQGPEYVGQTVRPMDEAPTMETVEVPDQPRDPPADLAALAALDAIEAIGNAAPHPTPHEPAVPVAGDTELATPNPAAVALARAAAALSIPSTNETRNGFYVMGEFVPFDPDAPNQPRQTLGEVRAEVEGPPVIQESSHPTPADPWPSWQPSYGTETTPAVPMGACIDDTELDNRPRLRAVPSLASNPGPAPAEPVHHQNTPSNGATTMSEETSDTPKIEIATVRTMTGYGEHTTEYARGELGSKIETARAAASKAGFLNDPEIVSVFGRYDEVKNALARVGEDLVEAMAAHKASEEAVSGLGNRAAYETASYKPQ